MDWKKISSEQRKYIVILVLMTVVGVGLMLVGNGQKKTNEVGELNNPTPLVRENVSQSAEKEKENQLAEVLAAIEGVGKVWVDITFACEGTTEYAYDEQRSESQYQKTLVIVSKGQGSTEPVVVRKEKAKIVGVLVVAQGAENPQVEAELVRVVETLLGVAAHEVVIMPGDSEVRM